MQIYVKKQENEHKNAHVLLELLLAFTKTNMNLHIIMCRFMLRNKKMNIKMHMFLLELLLVFTKTNMNLHIIMCRFMLEFPQNAHEY